MSASSSSLRPHVRARREGANLRPAELARLAGITRQALHSIETGNSTPNTLVAFGLARALGCTVDELFSFVAQEVGATLAAPIAGDARVQLAQVGERLLAFPLGGTPGFHQLADGIARLPPGGAGEASSARVELSGSLDRPRRTAVLVGCDPSLELLSGHVARHTPEVRVLWRSASSQAALEALGRGEAHAAGIHLWDAAAGLSNLPFVERAFPGQPMHLFTLWSWEQGLMLPPGNPAGLSGPADLLRPGLRFVNREPGAGSRLLLDAWLSAQGLGPARR
ncbi:MAG: substrate-binding domain-containing protein, partial [Deinococcus sp.]